MVPASVTAGLQALGITHPTEIYRNLNLEQLNAHEIVNQEGDFINNGTFAVDTGKFTGRSPNDKWIVKQSPSEENIWWGSVNQPISPYAFNELEKLVLDHYNTVDKVRSHYNVVYS